MSRWDTQAASGTGPGTGPPSSSDRRAQIDILAQSMVAIAGSVVRRNDGEARVVATSARAAVDRLNMRPASVPHAAEDMQVIFADFNEKLSHRNNEMFVDKFCGYLAVVYGEKHVVLSDIYSIIATARAKASKLADALEWAGRALLIRMESLGLMCDKTAESHFNLGLIYRLLGDMAQSRKHLKICRNIRCKLAGPDTLTVANCDLNLGHTEKAANCFEAAYHHFYNCYMTRFALLGGDHPQTVVARQLSEENNNVNGERLFTASELKDRCLLLQWACSGGRLEEEHEYATSLFLCKLHSEEVLRESQLKSVLLKAVRFASHKQSSGSNNSNSSSSPNIGSNGNTSNPNSPTRPPPAQIEDVSRLYAKLTQAPNSASASMTAGTPLTPNQRSSLIVVQDRQQSEQGRRRSFLALSPSAQVQTQHGASPAVPIVTSQTTSVPSPVHVSTSSHSGTPAATSSGTMLIAADEMERTRLTPLTNTTSNTKSQSQLQSQSPVNHSSQHASSKESTIATTSPMATTAAQRLTFDRTPPPPQAPASSSSFLLSTTPSDKDKKVSFSGATNNTNNNSTNNTNMTPPFSQSQSQTLSSSGTLPLQQSPKTSFSTAEATVTVETTPVLPFYVGNHVTLLTHDSSGNRVAVRRATAQDIIESARPKVHALGVLSLLVDRMKGVQRLPEVVVKASTTSTPTVASANTAVKPVLDPTESPKKLIVNGTKDDINISANDGSSDGGNKAAAKTALADLFKKRSQPSAEPAEAAATGMMDIASVAQSKSEEAAVKVIPQPPPLPTSWPPVPYMLSRGADSESIGPDSTISRTTEELGVSGLNRPKKASKVKQIQLDTLRNTAGTIWEDNTESVFKAEELFTDIDEEFSIVAKPALGSKGGSNVKGALNLDAVKQAITSKAKPKPEGALDPQRAQNISIMLAKFGRRTVSEIAKCIVDFEPGVMGPQAIQSVMQYLPTPDEAKAIAKYALELQNDPSKAKSLPKAEEYFLTVSKISRCEERLSAMLTCVTSNEVFEAVQNQSELMLRAVNEVKDSTRLKYILKAILDLWNILGVKENEHQVAASGFSLNSIGKLSATKTNSGESAEQYLVSRIYAVMPEALELVRDMPSIEDAKQIIFPRLRSDLQRLSTGLELLKRLSTHEDEPMDTRAKIQGYFDGVSAQYARAAASLKEAESDFQELCVYLGEVEAPSDSATPRAPAATTSTSSMDPEKLFGALTKFIASIEVCLNIAVAKAKKKQKMMMIGGR